MLQYVGISLVTVVIGMVIAMTAGVIYRTVLKELEGYKDRQNQKALAIISKMTEKMVKGVLELSDEIKKREQKKDEEFKKEVEVEIEAEADWDDLEPVKE